MTGVCAVGKAATTKALFTVRDREEEEEEGNESQIGQNQQKVVRAEPWMKARSVGSSVLRERSCFLDGF